MVATAMTLGTPENGPRYAFWSAAIKEDTGCFRRCARRRCGSPGGAGWKHVWYGAGGAHKGNTAGLRHVGYVAGGGTGGAHDGYGGILHDPGGQRPGISASKTINDQVAVTLGHSQFPTSSEFVNHFTAEHSLWRWVPLSRSPWYPKTWPDSSYLGPFMAMEPLQITTIGRSFQH